MLIAICSAEEPQCATGFASALLVVRQTAPDNCTLDPNGYDEHIGGSQEGAHVVYVPGSFNPISAYNRLDPAGRA